MSDHLTAKTMSTEEQTCKKSRFRDRWSQPHGHFWCHILVSWDLFFGQCHFWSLKTVDLATILGKHNQNWQVLVFLTLLCIVLGFVAKLCRESRCFGVKFYVANHTVLVPHFDAQKGVHATNQLFCRSAPPFWTVLVTRWFHQRQWCWYLFDLHSLFLSGLPFTSEMFKRK